VYYFVRRKMKTPSATFQRRCESAKSKLLWKLLVLELGNTRAAEKFVKSLELLKCKKGKQIQIHVLFCKRVIYDF